MSRWMTEARRMVRHEVRRALNVVRRGVLGAGVSSSYTCKIEGAGGDDFEGVESWQHFGFASRPPVSGEVLVVLPFGSGEGAIVCAEQDRSQRPALAAKEVVVYGYLSGAVQSKITMRANGDIDLVPGAGQVVRVGDSSGTEFLLLGATVLADIKSFADAVKVIVPGLEAQNATALGVIKTAASAMSTETAGWLCSIAKGK